MESTAVEALICPVCGLEFVPTLAGETDLKCIDGHSFDIARQGYVNLLTGHGTRFQPDTASMVEARDNFLDAGHYEPLARKVAALAASALPSERTSTEPPLIVDAGTGTGYYLRHILDAGTGHSDSVGLDISKFALRRAARRNPATVNLVWDIWQPLPIAARAADVVVVVFAPRNAVEFARILRRDGLLIVVTPLPGHLAEIAEETGMLGIQPEKDAALQQSLGGHFRAADVQELRYEMMLDPDDVAHVALMGPSGHHLDPAVLARRAGSKEPVIVTAAFRISTFHPLQPDGTNPAE